MALKDQNQINDIASDISIEVLMEHGFIDPDNVVVVSVTTIQAMIEKAIVKTYASIQADEVES